jgi:hypothetical protein
MPSRSAGDHRAVDMIEDLMLGLVLMLEKKRRRE